MANELFAWFYIEEGRFINESALRRRGIQTHTQSLNNAIECWALILGAYKKNARPYNDFLANLIENNIKVSESQLTEELNDAENNVLSFTGESAYQHPEMFRMPQQQQSLYKSGCVLLPISLRMYLSEIGVELIAAATKKLVLPKVVIQKYRYCSLDEKNTLYVDITLQNARVTYHRFELGSVNEFTDFDVSNSKPVLEVGLSYEAIKIQVTGKDMLNKPYAEHAYVQVSS